MDERPKCEKQAYHVKKRYCKKISLWQREEKEFLKEHSKYTNFKAKKKEINMNAPKSRMNTGKVRDVTDQGMWNL